MGLKHQGDLDELCYPFIYEQSSLCDYEILTDELCTLTGLAASACAALDAAGADVAESLLALQPKIFHLNGSIRGRCAIDEAEISWLKQQMHSFREQLTVSEPGFILPRGTGPVVLLHQCRSLSKKVTRALVRVDAEGREVPATLPRYSNLLTNYYFVLTRALNQRAGVEEPIYISANYGRSRGG